MLWFLVAGFRRVPGTHCAVSVPAGALRTLEILVARAARRRAVDNHLTYDDRPNPNAAPALLDVLRDGGAHPTFFLVDAHLTEATAPIVRRMFDEGHAAALHSDTRALLIKTPSELAAVLTQHADRIEQLAGSRPCRLFRPHAGWRSGSMYEGLARIDHRLVGWSWRLWDWNWYQARDADELARRLARRASPGDVIVMHDGHHIDSAADSSVRCRGDAAADYLIEGHRDLHSVRSAAPPISVRQPDGRCCRLPA
jgi:peptidoglycan/xylan/chitin deacetylase (PgdA/CDA1 family)